MQSIKTMKNSKRIEEIEQDKQNLNKVVNKLEQRIATLERVLQSHAKCIGEMRDDLEDMPEEVLVKTWGNE